MEQLHITNGAGDATKNIRWKLEALQRINSLCDGELLWIFGFERSPEKSEFGRFLENSDNFQRLTTSKSIHFCYV